MTVLSQVKSCQLLVELRRKRNVFWHKGGNCKICDSVAPTFSENLKPVTISEGEKLTLRCNVTGTPDPDVVWYKDGNNLSQNEKAMIKNRSGLCSLSIPEVTLSDAGEYSCQARNDEGEDEISARVIVKPKVIILPSPKPDLPEFIRHPQGRILNDGDPVTIECQVKGTCSVVWYKGGEVIHDNEDFRYVTSGEVHRLEVAEVFPEDSGTYCVEASNETGTSSSFFTVLVNVPDEECSGPVFHEFPRSLHVDEGAKVVFTCRLDKAHTVTWLKGSQALDETGRYRISTGDNSSTLTIPTVLAPDAGMFAVEANNEKGNSLWTFTLGVTVSCSPCADIDVASLIRSAQQLQTP